MSSTPSGTGKPRYLQELQLADGKKVIVSLPEDLERLRQKYANQDDIQIEVVVQGSAEHCNYLRQAQDLHSSQKAKLRERHGAAFDEWEDVHNQLTRVTTELDRLQNQTSGLNANFSKFGYGAELRTYDGDAPPGLSPRDSRRHGSSGERVSEERLGETVKLFKKPVVRQWFHRGLLWRASAQTEIMAVELFFDLIYVAIIHTNGEHLAVDATGEDLLRFAITFLMSWKIWADVTQWLSWYETDDILTRLEILFAIACLVGFTTNMIYSFSDDPAHNTYTQLVSFYLAVRLLAAIHHTTTSYFLRMIRGAALCEAIVSYIPAALWIASIHVDMPGRLGLIFPALIIDLWGQMPIIMLYMYGRKQGAETKLGGWVSRFFEFFPAMSIEHRVERTNAFVSLVLGYSVVGIMYQNYGPYNVNAFLGKAVLGLIQAFVFNWIYFDVDAQNIKTHAIRRSGLTASIWQNAHLPLVMGYILASAALSKLVLTTDVANTNPEELSEEYRENSDELIPNGIRFFYCQGLGVCLLAMGAIGLCHDHKELVAQRLAKKWRLLNRLAVCIVMLCLPTANGLTSLDLISITMGLSTWVLLLEVYGGSSKNDPFIGEAKGCSIKYSAKADSGDVETGGSFEGTDVPRADILALDRNEKTAVEI